MRNFSTKAVEEIKTLSLSSGSFFFGKSYRLWDNVEKYCRVGQAIDDNMEHAECLLDNTYCFPTATMVARTRLNVTLYVHCLSCSLFWRYGCNYWRLAGSGICRCLCRTSRKLRHLLDKVTVIYSSYIQQIIIHISLNAAVSVYRTTHTLVK
jgi:hypothetical protein